MNITQSDINRFWSKVNLIYKDDEKQVLDYDACWEWNTGKIGKNYGSFYYDYKKRYAHRFSYIIHNNFKIINSIDLICHKCDNTLCVNPNHLFLGTSKDNSQDMVNKGRSSFGEKCGTSILTENQVRQILIDIWNNKYQNVYQISRKYNINSGTIRDILDMKTWTTVTDQLEIPISMIKNKVYNKTGGSAKLSILDVKIIKHLLLDENNRISDIADKFMVSDHAIKNIKKNKTWKHVVI